MYGKGVVAEQSYRMASNAAFDYLQKEKIDYLGDVIPSDEQGGFDFENGKEFEFVFEFGEAPEIKLDLTEKDKVTYNRIKVDKKMHDDYRSNFLRRFGRLVDTEKVTADEALGVTLDNGDMNVADAYVGLISMSEEERKPFIGKKVGDTLDFGGLLGYAPVMPSYAGLLSDGEIQELTAYIRSLGAGPRVIRTPGLPPLSSRVPGTAPARSPAMVPGAPVSDTPAPAGPAVRP